MRRRPFVLMLASLAAIVVLGCTKTAESGGSPDKLKRLTVDEVATRLATKDGKTFVYDNNSPQSYKKGHIPGAKWLDDEKVTAADLPSDKSATLIFYCHNET